MLNFALPKTQLLIAEQAISMKTGARALRSIMENIMLDIMYDLPTIEEPVEVVISAGVVKGKIQSENFYSES